MKESEIFINQIGYRPFDVKNVFVSKAAKADATEFSVLEKAGGKVNILDLVKSEDLDYTEDGKLINATDEHGFLNEKSAELIKKNSWHHSNVKEVLGDNK